jgi:hypothetical protein
VVCARSQARPVGDHGVQHGECVALYSGGDRQAAGYQQRAAAASDGSARTGLPEPSKVELVKELNSPSGTPNIFPHSLGGAGR